MELSYPSQAQVIRNSAGEPVAGFAPPVHLIVPADDPLYETLFPLDTPRNSAWEREARAFHSAYPNCMVCDTRVDCQVHHKFPVHLFPDREMNHKFWRTMCRTHHLWIGHLGSWYSWNEHLDEDIVTWRDKITNRPKGTVPAGTTFPTKPGESTGGGESS